MENFQVYAFDYTDHSMYMGRHEHSEKIHFYPIALGIENKVESDDDPWETKTFSSIHEMLSPLHGENTTIDYLKIHPIEDLNVLKQIIESGFLKRVRQLSLKIVVPSEMEQYHKEYFMDIDAKVLQRIDNEGEMVRFDCRGNYLKDRKLNRKITSYYAYELAWFNVGKIYGNRS